MLIVSHVFVYHPNSFFILRFFVHLGFQTSPGNPMYQCHKAMNCELSPQAKSAEIWIYEVMHFKMWENSKECGYWDWDNVYSTCKVVQISRCSVYLNLYLSRAGSQNIDALSLFIEKYRASQPCKYKPIWRLPSHRLHSYIFCAGFRALHFPLITRSLMVGWNEML